MEPNYQRLNQIIMNYRKQKPTITSISRNTSVEGETIEMKVERIVNNKEPISDGAPIVYTERQDGVKPEYDIRTDRFEIAVDAMDAISKSHTAKREMRAEAKKKEKDGEAKPIQGQAEDSKSTQTT